MSWTAILAGTGTFVGAVCVMGGLAAWVDVWRIGRRAQRAAADTERRLMRCRMQAVIDNEYRLHGYSALSHQLRAEARADGVPA